MLERIPIDMYNVRISKCINYVYICACTCTYFQNIPQHFRTFCYELKYVHTKISKNVPKNIEIPKNVSTPKYSYLQAFLVKHAIDV